MAAPEGHSRALLAAWRAASRIPTRCGRSSIHAHNTDTGDLTSTGCPQAPCRYKLESHRLPLGNTGTENPRPWPGTRGSRLTHTTPQLEAGPGTVLWAFSSPAGQSGRREGRSNGRAGCPVISPGHRTRPPASQPCDPG